MESTKQIKEWEALALKAGFERDGDNLLPPTGAICIDPELMRFAAAVTDAERKACADCAPSNWLDSMLTGEKSVLTGKGREGAVEAVLIEVKNRILARSNAKVTGSPALSASPSGLTG